jgi:hypothetical protein
MKNINKLYLIIVALFSYNINAQSSLDTSVFASEYMFGGRFLGEGQIKLYYFEKGIPFTIDGTDLSKKTVYATLAEDASGQSMGIGIATINFPSTARIRNKDQDTRKKIENLQLKVVNNKVHYAFWKGQENNPQGEGHIERWNNGNIVIYLYNYLTKEGTKLIFDTFKFEKYLLSTVSYHEIINKTLHSLGHKVIGVFFGNEFPGSGFSLGFSINVKDFNFYKPGTKDLLPNFFSIKTLEACHYCPEHITDWVKNRITVGGIVKEKHITYQDLLHEKIIIIEPMTQEDINRFPTLWGGKKR